ncbi:MAG: alpha/beta hydrolase [Deltaproteobacteria bacterium]|nr:alpha/beta hydrolase [Deltaproteobacteria bacterium]
MNGLWLNVSDWGGEGDVLFFAHPTGFLGALWRPIIERLRRAGVTSRIYSYDQRGHGLSSKPDSGYEWGNFVEDTAQLMRLLGIENALGIGHSAGGTTLAAVASREPRRLRRLVMIDPVLYEPALARLVAELGGNPMVARTRTRRMVWSSREELFGSYRKREPYSTWTDEALRVYVNEGTFERPDGEIELLCPARVEAQVYSAAPDFDAFDCLGKLTTSVLLLRGERSTTFDEERARRAVEAAPHARLLTIPGTTHFIPMERPDEVARLILAEAACDGSGERRR